MARSLKPIVDPFAWPLCLLLAGLSSCGVSPSTGGSQTDVTNDSVDPLPTVLPVWREAFAHEGGFLSAVWGSRPGDVFMVGGQPELGEVYHFDGITWSRMNVPEVPILVWVFGFDQNDVFAVGEQGGAIHYDGATWRTMETGTNIDLFGVWGVSGNDIWAVGGEIDTGPPVLLHYDGTTWAEVQLPTLDRPSTALLKVWGTSATHLFAVGQTGVILAFDGNEWRQVPSGTAEDLVTLWGTGPDNIVAVGGRSNGVVVIYDGRSWRSQSATPLPGLNGAFIDDPAEAIVVGLFGTAAVLDLPFFSITPEPTPTVLTLHAVWGDGASKTYAVGGCSNELPYRGVALVRTIDGSKP